VASLRQALSDVMFFLLFQAGELLQSRADEDLARRVRTSSPRSIEPGPLG
jgi:hypothetical protein